MASRNFPLKGIIATAFAPFKNDSEKSLNLKIIPDYAEYFASHGFTTVLINGTYGEGMSMTRDERIEIANAWSEAAKITKQQLIVQVGGTNLKEVKILAKHAESIKASAILCLPELYYKPSTIDQLIDYLSEVGKAAPNTPLYYYDSPIATGVHLNMANLFKEVGRRIPTLYGIKFASTNLADLSLALRASAGRFQIIFANNYVLPAAIALGIDTFMPTAVNVAPDVVQKVVNLANANDLAGAREHQQELAVVLDTMAEFNNGCLIPSMKSLTSHLMSLDLGPSRKPLQCLNVPNALSAEFQRVNKF